MSLAIHVNIRILKLTCAEQRGFNLIVGLQRYTFSFIENHLHRVPLTMTKIRAALMLTVIDDLTKT